jgi:hypothetical protein
LLTPLVNWLEGFYGVIYHVLIRFGKFKEIICIPEPKNKELFICTTAVYYYAMGIAYAVLGQIE